MQTDISAAREHISGQMAGKRYRKGFFIGRFQPFHHGHRYAIMYALARADRLVIGIGSAQEHSTKTNPLNFRTRLRTAKAGLKAASIDVSRVRFLKVPDFGNDNDWFNYIKSRHPDIDVVFTGNDWVKRIFKRRGIDVMEPPMHKRSELSGTNVRLRIRSDQRWRHLVPHTVAGIVERHKRTIKASAAKRDGHRR